MGGGRETGPLSGPLKREDGPCGAWAAVPLSGTIAIFLRLISFSGLGLFLALFGFLSLVRL